MMLEYGRLGKGRYLLFAELWRMVDQEVNDDVAHACFQQDRHFAECNATMFVRDYILMDASNCQSLPRARAADEVERVR